MTHHKPPATPDAALRARAEAAATLRSTPTQIASDTWPAEAKAMLHELRVHQIELELQNEELRRTHEELEASRARYFDLYDLSPAGYCTVSAEGLIVVANLTLATLLDLPRSASGTQLFSGCILREDQEVFFRFRHALLAAWTAGATPSARERSCELQLKRRDGTLVWVTLTGNVTTVDGGEPALNLAVTDISERKAAEAALREREHQHGAILDSLKTSTVVLDDRGVIVFVNAEWKRLAVESNAPELSTEAVGQNYLAVCDRAATYPDDADAVAVAAGLRAVLSGDQPFFEREYPCHTATARRWFLLTIVRLVGPRAGVVLTHADITAVKRAELRLRRLVESDAQGVLFWNAQGDVTNANGAFLAMTGYTRDELMAGVINQRSITPPEFAPLDDAALHEVVTKGTCASYEKEFFRRDGSRVPVLIGAASFEDDPSSGVAFVVDLTDRKLAERQLIRGQRLQSLGTLTSGIAHDMNNMLSPIVCSIEVLKAGSRSDAELEVIDILEASATRGSELVKQILTFSRGGVGPRVNMQVVDTLHDLEKTIRDTFPPSVEFRLSAAPGVGAINADPTQMHQVFLNLCLNARDAMPTGGTLSVDVTAVTIPDAPRGRLADMAAGAYVRVSVTDTGDGMRPEIIEQVFDPFFTTKPVGEGTGLGLSMVRGIVTGHGGYVTVDSQLGHGTTFAVYLPAAAPPPTNDARRSQGPPPHGAGETILVVDDELAVRTLTKFLLERFGYHVLTAGGGAEALAIYAERRADVRLVITDLSMPGMNGVDLTRALQEQMSPVPVVVASGFMSDDQLAQIEALRRAGNVSAIQKPYTANELLSLLQSLLPT